MPKLKLRYFDFHGGRGEVARLAFVLGNIAFEDDRFPVSDWPNMRDSIPFRAVPVLEVDGEIISQSNSINRYAGKLANLYPDDPLEALRCDEVMAAVEDAIAQIVSTFGIEDQAELRVAREALADGVISLILRRLDEILVSRGGAFFAGGSLSVADLKVYVWVNGLKSGVLDHIPTDLVDRVAPNLVKQYEAIAAMPEIAAYYSN